MKRRVAVLLAALAVLLGLPAGALSATAASAASAPASLVPTFSSVGVYWSPLGGSASVAATTHYRPLGTATWQRGTDLWFDGRAQAGRPQEYRGSLLGLRSGTTYEVRLAMAGTAETVTQTVRTWSESFPVGKRIELPASSTRPLDLTEVGSPSGYVLVTGPGGGPATIDVQNAADYNIRLSASSYVIVRGLTLKGAKRHGIQLGTGPEDVVHDVVIEGNSISGWGTPDASGFGTNMDSAVYSESSALTRVVVQGNSITSPRTTSNSWKELHNGTYHPQGPQGISLRRGKGNHVIRYNDIVGDPTHHFNDGMGGTANFSYSGFPGNDSDVIGNYIAYTWDDGIEAEGGLSNVRISDNYLTEVYHAFGMAAVSQGPLYAVRNVQDVARGDAAATYGQAMFKMGGKTSGTTFYGDGRTYLFHNTALKPLVGPQNRKAIEAGDGRVLRNLVSRNNILRTGAPSGSYSISDDSVSPTNSYDYDLYNGLIRAAAGAEPHGVKAEPVHALGWGMDATTRSGSFALAAGTPGVDRGVALPGINDGFTGTAPDIGAHETTTGQVTYGRRAHVAAPAPTTTTTAPAAGVTTPTTRTITVPASADAMVKQASATTAFGSGGTVRADRQELSTTGSAVHSYLRFDVAGLAAGERVVSAALSLRTAVGGGTADGPALWRTANATSAAAAEAITWTSGRPARSGTAAVGNFGAVAADARSTAAVSGVTGNGVVSFELAPDSNDGMDVLARETATAADRPQLVITVTTA